MSDLAPAPVTFPLSAAPDDHDLPRPRTLPPHVLRAGADVARFYSTFARGAAFPAFAGVVLFGWRALAMLGVMAVTAAIATRVWQQVGARGRQLHASHVAWNLLLLWLVLPAHLLANAGPGQRVDPWPIPIAASVLLVIMMWLLGGVGSGRIHPVLATYLLTVALFESLLAPTAVLQRDRLFLGDVTRAAAPLTPAHAYNKDGYLKTPAVPGNDALLLDPPASRLTSFTSGSRRPGRAWLSLESLLRDEMPPLEDLIIGGHPAPIGAACAVAVIIGGLYLLYRGVIDFRVPLCILIGAYVALVLLPVPTLIRDSGPQWQWAAFRDAANVGWAKVATLANYEVMSGPLLLVTFFFATAPILRPMARRARVIYGLLVGVAAAGFQLYLSIPIGPYLAVLVVSLLTPLLDRTFRQHPLV
ncbi:MAG TPA: RnfABCDGE type electron transport complex subunit D [Tepidisphaeraceae bacterium]|nr:RnfABCDGE type electron transport complex subunit D [Tepidisphaeraceae bacterium]